VFRTPRFLIPLVLGAVLRADAGMDQAVSLYRARRYGEAEAALEPMAASRPRDAAACYYLGMCLRHGAGGGALDAAVPWLEKAAALAPDNAVYLGDLGGTCLQLADRHRSFSFATRGRAAMEKAIRLDPGYLEAREGLMQFYARAPWPLGSALKARAQAGEILRRDAARGVRAFIYLGRELEKSGSRAAAREAYATALKADPGCAEARSAVARLDAVSR